MILTSASVFQISPNRVIGNNHFGSVSVFSNGKSSFVYKSPTIWGFSRNSWPISIVVLVDKEDRK